MIMAREVNPGCESLRQKSTVPVMLESMHPGGRRVADKGSAKRSHKSMPDTVQDMYNSL